MTTPPRPAGSTQTGGGAMVAYNPAPQQAPWFAARGMPGATTVSRYMGGTLSGAPISGTFVTGDFVIDQSGAVWICTAGGSPGIWTGSSAVSASFTVSGLPGATAASRYAGGTVAGAPATGAFAKGDFVIDQSGAVWICTAAGSPGIWTGPAVTAPTLTVTGLPGATAVSRYAGGTTSGAPATGSFALGDFVIDQSGVVWVCTAAGSPGIWASPSAPSTPASVTVTGLTGATAASQYAGGTVAGAPATGTFVTGDFVIDQSGTVWICTAGGSPGIWTGPAATPVTLTVTGLTGATTVTRYVGGTASGPPVTGAFALGDFVVDQSGTVWVCTAAGSPGTWAAHSRQTAEPLTLGEAIIPRIGLNGPVTPALGEMLITYWTAATSGAASTVTTVTGLIAGVDLTYAAIGIYEVAGNGDLTLLTDTGDLHATLWASASTVYASTLTAPFTRVAGTRYAMGALATGTTAPALIGNAYAGAFATAEPLVGATFGSALAALPATAATGSITGGYSMVGAIVYTPTS